MYNFRWVAVGIFVAFSVAPPLAAAQTVVQADAVSLQPQIGRDEGGFSSCGVNIVAIDSKRGVMDAYSFSLSLRINSPIGMLKVGKVTSTVSAAEAGKFNTKTALPAPVGFWIAGETEGKALRPIRITASEDSGYVVGAADLLGTLRAILAVTNGDRIQFSVLFKNDQTDTVMAFSKQMPDVERKPLIFCLDELVKRNASGIN